MLNDFVGKEDIKQLIRFKIESAKHEGSNLPNIIISGPGGTGKTTIAHIIANEFGAKIHEHSARSFSNVNVFNQAIYTVKKGEILFIDEIQDLPKRFWTILYKVMEEKTLPIVVGGRSVNVTLDDFTIMGATTDTGSLSSSLIDRFDGGHIQIGAYSKEDLKTLFQIRSTVNVNDDALDLLSRAARGTPRIAVGIAKHINSFIKLYNLQSFDVVNAGQALSLIGIDKYGLNATDREYIRILMELFRFQSVAIDTIEGIIGVNKKTLISDHEPYLMSEGYLIKSGRGRTLTDEGMKIYNILFN